MRPVALVTGLSGVVGATAAPLLAASFEVVALTGRRALDVDCEQVPIDLRAPGLGLDAGAFALLAKRANVACTFGSGDLYGSGRPAARGAMVVAVNYRLGVTGFLSHPALGTSGGVGLEDRQAALRWVRANAGAFGGDPGNVTIMGQSGGGYSVCGHLASPASAGLFHRAIVQSAPCATWTRARS
ncbi:carboxylesterase family protein [Streptomyces sp. NPDC048507]|uniref:carboxylesterase family protein n=1 Tax=Streptomyces sp. NPDC048507 TaxID=3365560 RepID=UPI0037214743